MPTSRRRRGGEPTSESSLGISSLGKSDPEERYFAWAEQFYRRGVRTLRQRSAAVMTAWTASLVLGAAVPLTTSVGGPTWVTSVLGFSIVVVQGLQKFYAQRSGMTGELDALVRSMAQEARTLKAEQPPYADPQVRLTNFHKAIEDLMADYNKASNNLTRRLGQES